MDDEAAEHLLWSKAELEERRRDATRMNAEAEAAEPHPGRRPRGPRGSPSLLRYSQSSTDLYSRDQTGKELYLTKYSNGTQFYLNKSLEERLSSQDLSDREGIEPEDEQSAVPPLNMLDVTNQYRFMAEFKLLAQQALNAQTYHDTGQSKGKATAQTTRLGPSDDRHVLAYRAKWYTNLGKIAGAYHLLAYRQSYLQQFARQTTITECPGNLRIVFQRVIDQLARVAHVTSPLTFEEFNLNPDVNDEKTAIDLIGELHEILMKSIVNDNALVQLPHEQLKKITVSIMLNNPKITFNTKVEMACVAMYIYPETVFESNSAAVRGFIQANNTYLESIREIEKALKDMESR